MVDLHDSGSKTRPSVHSPVVCGRTLVVRSARPQGRLPAFVLVVGSVPESRSRHRMPSVQTVVAEVHASEAVAGGSRAPKHSFSDRLNKRLCHGFGKIE